MWSGKLFGYDELMRRSACVRGPCKFALLQCAIFLFISGAVCAQAPDSQDDASNKSWTATTDSKEDYANPTRTIRSHTENGNRTVDVSSLQRRGGDGNLNPYQDIETETVRVNSTTTRTTTRTFVRDDNGDKTLFQVTEEDKQTLPGGNSKIACTTSNPDANGNLQVVQRENRETVKISRDVAETNTVIMLPSINGGLTPAMQIQERENHTGNSVEIRKTTQLPDGAGSWQVAEVRHTTTRDEGKNRRGEESVSRPDLDGNLAEVTRTIVKESKDMSGSHREKSEETYSIDQPGATRDGSLYLVQRVTTAQHGAADNQQTTTVLERADPGDPGAGLWVTTATKENARLGPSGAQENVTIQQRDANGNFDVVSVDTTKADSVHAINVQISASAAK